MNRIFKPFVFLVAAIYFLVDAAFWTVAHPVSRLLADWRILDGLRAWIISLRPYPTLALFAVPVVILEPVKPVAAYLTATGHIAGGLLVLAVGELLKLVLIERLFRLSREKLMSIPAFSWCYGKFQLARDWIESLAAWRLMRRFNLMMKRAVRRHMLDMKPSRRQGRLSLQSR